jgi:hypothetical protein
MFTKHHRKAPEVDTAASRAVECLLSKLTHKGHILYVDHFYASLPLADQEAEEKNGLEETIMESQKGLPKTLPWAKINKG